MSSKVINLIDTCALVNDGGTLSAEQEQAAISHGLAECDDIGHFSLTDKGRAVLDAIPPRAPAKVPEVRGSIRMVTDKELAQEVAQANFNATLNVQIGDSPLAHQESGTHYKSCPIQPIEYIHANGLGFMEGNVVKYITRHKTKNGAADIRKAIHYCQLLLELEYRER